jgi:hypothetical protein
VKPEPNKLEKGKGYLEHTKNVYYAFERMILNKGQKCTKVMIMKPEPNKLEKGKGSLEHNKKSVLCF